MSYGVTFINSEGISINLNDGVNCFAMTGISNDLMPEFEFQESSSPLIHGSIINAARIKQRDYLLPIMFIDADRASVLARIRSTAKYLDPRLGDGQLHITSDGIERVLTCRYRSGLSSDGQGEDQYTNYIKGVIDFYASDPYFYAASPTIMQVSGDWSPRSFFPILPVLIANSTNSASATLSNGGDVDAWSIITITGPGSYFCITNHTSGKFIIINTTILAGETLIIDTRPRTRGVRDGNGVNKFDYLSADSALFPMIRGSNFVEIEIVGGSASTSVKVQYTPAFFTV
jgi:phage-related protein